MHYEFQKSGAWKMGTGWLIRPDVLVTAGHCSYDWGHKLGRATEVKAYIGYNGKDSTNESSVQFRSVKRIVTTEGWVKVKGQKSFDVSFMQVETPFTGITPVHFEETPSQGSLVLGVVGYPGDKKDKHGQPGAQMYEMFHQTEFNLATQADTMLEYRIDTYGGETCLNLNIPGSLFLTLVDQVILELQSSDNATWSPLVHTCTEGHSTLLRSLGNMAIHMKTTSLLSGWLCQIKP